MPDTQTEKVFVTWHAHGHIALLKYLGTTEYCTECTYIHICHRHTIHRSIVIARHRHRHCPIVVVVARMNVNWCVRVNNLPIKTRFIAFGNFVLTENMPSLFPIVVHIVVANARAPKRRRRRCAECCVQHAALVLKLGWWWCDFTCALVFIYFRWLWYKYYTDAVYTHSSSIAATHTNTATRRLRWRCRENGKMTQPSASIWRGPGSKCRDAAALRLCVCRASVKCDTNKW